MKIYTRTGDQGSTGLFGGGRVAKCDLRICACGALDELNAMLGAARSMGVSPRIDDILKLLQNRMFDLGAELASPQARDRGTQFLQEADVAELESFIDSLEETLPELKAFILPGGSQATSFLHIARSVCRRAEREMVALAQTAELRDTLIKYVNRASDLLFVLARTANAEAKIDDVPWEKRK
ncbi:MAG: cob(I)yrinic acid a,c-diamide adenosyltransferase [Planctomycetes bacterium]|nr:cob(I)yrinic acid a,c-diamide adenosyltransferase [Planctomycetota bacterium]